MAWTPHGSNDTIEFPGRGPSCAVRGTRDLGGGVVAVGRAGPEAVHVIIEQVVVEGPCPICGVVSSAVKDRPLIQLKDLPVGLLHG